MAPAASPRSARLNAGQTRRQMQSVTLPRIEVSTAWLSEPPRSKPTRTRLRETNVLAISNGMAAATQIHHSFEPSYRPPSRVSKIRAATTRTLPHGPRAQSHRYQGADEARASPSDR